VRQPDADMALPRGNYYAPLAEEASQGDGAYSDDDELPDDRPAGAPLRRPASRQPAAARSKPAREQMPLARQAQRAYG
jgi:hypothetical protein